MTKSTENQSPELSLDDLQKQIAELELKKKAIIDAQRSEKLEEVKKIINLFGFTALDLGLSKRGRPAVDKDEE
jgi:hypothetical protein